MIFVTKVTVVRGLPVNRAQQVELLDDLRWLEVENLR